MSTLLSDARCARGRGIGRVAVWCALLPSVASIAFSLAGCDKSDKKPPTVTRERSQAVIAAEGAQPATAASAAPAPEAQASGAAAPKPPRKLCGGQLQGAGHALPKLSISRTAAAGAAQLPAALPLQEDVWTWLNFWAAWCVPCKEEIPRLKAWEKQLNAAGKSFQVVFVSLDDDPRQLQDFLKVEPAGGLRSTYWLREGKEREAWLKGALLPEDPGLPMHVLIDPKGKARCTINGAIEDGDYAQLLALIGG